MNHQLRRPEIHNIANVGEKVGEIPTLEQVHNKEVKIEFDSFETSLARTDPTYPVRSRFSCYERCTNALLGAAGKVSPKSQSKVSCELGDELSTPREQVKNNKKSYLLL